MVGDVFFDTLFELRARIEEQCIGSCMGLEQKFVAQKRARWKIGHLYSIADVTEEIQHQDRYVERFSSLNDWPRIFV